MTTLATPEITRTDDMAAVRALGAACGLEVSERDAEEIIAAWGARTGTGRLVGAIVLERDDGLDLVNWLAVDAEFRGRGLAGGLYAALEREARRRTSSVYLPLFAEPMLPGALSSDLCSLVPRRSRKCVTVEFGFAADGRRTSLRFYQPKVDQ